MKRFIIATLLCAIALISGIEARLYYQQSNLFQSDKTWITPEGGYAVRLKASLPLLRGHVVAVLPTGSANYLIKKSVQANKAPVGFVWDTTVASGSWCWVVIAGTSPFLAGGPITAGDILVVDEADGLCRKGNGVPPSEHDSETGHSFTTTASGSIGYCTAAFN